MAIDPSIANPTIANLGGAMAQGAAYGHTIGQARQANNLRNVYAQHGQGILAGDPQALNALAAAGDPQAAMGIQKDRLGMDISQANLEMDRQKFDLTIRKFEAELDQFDKTATAEDKRRAAEEMGRIALTLKNTPPDQLPQVAASLNVPDLDTPEKVEAAINAGVPYIDLWKGQQPSGKTNYSTVTGASLGLSPDQAAVFDRLPPEQKSKAADEIAKAAFGAKKGMAVRVGADGSVSLVQGDVEGFGNTATNTIEGKQINAGESLARLKDITTTFKPEFLQLQTRVGVAWANMKDKIGQASQDEQASIKEFVGWRTNAFRHLNRTLNELSGAAISPAEAVRLKGELGDPGEGVWDGDGPTEFLEKTENAATAARNALLRYQMWKAKGGVGNPWDTMELDNVRGAVQAAIRDAAQIAASEGFTGQAQKDRAKEILLKKYGIGEN